MKLLKKIFGSKRNPMLTKLEDSTSHSFKEIFYSFGFVYSEENLSKFLLSLSLNSLEEVKKQLTFDVAENNLEVYFVVDEYDNKSAILLIDYYEPLQKEKLLEQIPIKYFPSIEMKKLK